jgi:hypothetical protein
MGSKNLAAGGAVACVVDNYGIFRLDAFQRISRTSP